MREIKFRAYFQNEMCKINDILFDYKWNICNISLLTETWWEITTLKKIKLMQYTGLKDKNGKEIYEDDIVEYFDYLLGIENSWVIRYEECSFCIVNDVKFAISKDCKVIWNIYENPDLLNKQKDNE